MHDESRAWVQATVTLWGPWKRVVDLGGRDVNGTYRDLFGPETEYVAIDRRDGVSVDLVADVADVKTIPPGIGRFDLAICTNVMEHEPRWRGIFKTAARLLKRGGGVLVVTVPGANFPQHSHTGAALPPDEWYEARTSAELGVETMKLGMVNVAAWNDPTGMDAGIVAMT